MLTDIFKGSLILGSQSSVSGCRPCQSTHQPAPEALLGEALRKWGLPSDGIYLKGGRSARRRIGREPAHPAPGG